MMVRTNMSDRSLKKYSQNHIFYEVQMLFEVGNILSFRTASISTETLQNVLIESFALHLRNLISFLYPEGKTWDDDVIAEDFFDQASKSRSVLPKINPGLDAARRRANKQIAHLTRKRYSGTAPQKRWDPPSLAGKMKPLLLCFVREASPKKLHRRVKEIVTTL